MGHDVHFLERLSRVDSAQADRALALYRDNELVQALLRDAKIPESAARIALALESGPSSPHIVVARNGHFVTCLGPGMSVKNLPVISREKLDASMVRVCRNRDAEAVLDELDAVSPRSFNKLWNRMIRDAHKYSLEDVQPMLAVQPVFGDTWLELAGNDIGAYLEGFQIRAASHAPPALETRALEALWKCYWLWTHLLVLAAAGEPPRPELAWPVLQAALGTVTACGTLRGAWLRTMWAASRFGVEMVGPLKESYRTNVVPHHRWAVLSALAAIGLGHARVRGEVRKFLERSHEVPTPLVADDIKAQIREGDAALCGILVKLLEKGGAALAEFNREALANSSNAVLGTPEHGVSLLANDPQDIFASASELLTTTTYLPNIVGVAPEQLFLPAEQNRKRRDFELADAVQLLANSTYVHARDGHPPHPVRAEPKPGRNEPCPCGSGKKAKRCCAA